MSSIKETSNIFDLPVDNVGSIPNINLNINELNNNMQLQNSQENLQQNQAINSQTIPTNNNNNNQQMKLDQSTINQIINGLQQASLTGLTQLPSRDIPMDTSNISNDPQVQPNYIPPKNIDREDYINDYEKKENIINSYNNNEKINSSLDDFYNEIQIPLLISLLYFIFQLPFFKRFLYKNFIYLFGNDGNYNLYGLLFISVLFGLLIHLLIKTTHFFSKF